MQQICLQNVVTWQHNLTGIFYHEQNPNICSLCNLHKPSSFFCALCTKMHRSSHIIILFPSISWHFVQTCDINFIQKINRQIINIVLYCNHKEAQGGYKMKKYLVTIYTRSNACINPSKLIFYNIVEAKTAKQAKLYTWQYFDAWFNSMGYSRHDLRIEAKQYHSRVTRRKAW